MPDFVIKTQFRGADKLSPILKKLGIRVKRTGDQAGRAFKKASRQASTFGTVVKGILAAGLIQRGFATAGMAVRALGEEFIDFDKNITKAVTRLPGGLDRSSEAFKRMGEIARREAMRTEFSAAQTAAAMEQLALAGLNLDQSMAALPGTINLATNAAVGVEEATTIAVKTLGAFGLRTKDTVQLTKNLTRVNDVFSKTVSSATLDITGLFETLKFGGPAAFAAGQSIETFSTLTGVMADASIDASIAGTSMRRMFIEITKSAKQAKLKDIGVEIKDKVTGEFRDFLDILKDVNEGTREMGEVQRFATLEQIFGARAVGAVNVLLNRGDKSLRKFRDSLEKSGGAAKKMSDTIRKSIGNRLLVLRSALIELGIKFVTAFTGKAGKGLDNLIKKVQKFDMKPVIQGVKDAVKFVKDLWKAIKPLRDNMGFIVSLFIAYKGALIAVTAVEAIVFYWKLVKAVRAAGKAQGFLNIMMAANPIGLVIVGVTALIFIIIQLIRYWKEVGLAGERFVTTTAMGFLQLWTGLKQVFADFINFHIKGLNDLIGLLNKIPGVEIPTISLIEFDVEGDLKEIKRLQGALKDIRDEETGLGVQRGMAGVRGAGVRGPAAAPAPVTDITRAMEREWEIPAEITRFGAAERATQLIEEKTRARDIAREAVQAVLSETAIQAPNRSEAEAQKVMSEVLLRFENAPAGMSVEGQTTGGKPVKTEGLGRQ